MICSIFNTKDDQSEIGSVTKQLIRRIAYFWQKQTFRNFLALN
jgi:hypothetical protein